MAYDLPNRSTGHLVDAAGDWNPLIDATNDLDDRATAIEAINTTQTADISTLNSRTTNTSGDVGIGNQRLSDRLGSGVTSASTATAQLATLTSNLSTVDSRTTNTSGAVGIGNQRLSDRLGSGVTNASTATSQFSTLTTNVGTINTNLGTWSGGTAISRLQALELGGAGSWIAANSTQTVAYWATSPPGGTYTPTVLLFGSQQITPVGVSYSAGTFTIASGYTGWWSISTQFDLDLSSGAGHQLVLSIENGAFTVVHGSNAMYYPGSAYSSLNTTALVYLTAGDTIKVRPAIYVTGSATGNYTNAGPGTGRTHFRLRRIGA